MMRYRRCWKKTYPKSKPRKYPADEAIALVMLSDRAQRSVENRIRFGVELNVNAVRPIIQTLTQATSNKQQATILLTGSTFLRQRSVCGSCISEYQGCSLRRSRTTTHSAQSRIALIALLGALLIYFNYRYQRSTSGRVDAMVRQHIHTPPPVAHTRYYYFPIASLQHQLKRDCKLQHQYISFST